MKQRTLILLALCSALFFFLGTLCNPPINIEKKPQQSTVEDFFKVFDSGFDSGNKNSFGGLTLDYSTLKQLLDSSCFYDFTPNQDVSITTPIDYRIALVVDSLSSSKMLLIEPRYKDTEQGRPTRYKFILSENKFERAAVSDIAVGKWYAFEQAESSFLKSFNELLFTSVIAQTSSERGVRKCPPSSNCARTVSPTIVTIPSDETKIDSLIQIK